MTRTELESENEALRGTIEQLQSRQINRGQVRTIIHQEIVSAKVQRLFHNPTTAAMNQAADSIADALIASLEEEAAEAPAPEQ